MHNGELAQDHSLMIIMQAWIMTIHSIVFYLTLKRGMKSSPLQKENTIRQLSQILGASSPLIFEPIIQPHKGRPLGSTKRKASNSTRREPSQFEVVEKAPRKCSGCGNLGHYVHVCFLGLARTVLYKKY